VSCVVVAPPHARTVNVSRAQQDTRMRTHESLAQLSPVTSAQTSVENVMA
jgi:hypothetical protein